MEKRLDQRKTSSNLETKLAISLETQYEGMLRVGTLYEVMRTVIWVMLQPEVMKHIKSEVADDVNYQESSYLLETHLIWG